MERVPMQCLPGYGDKSPCARAVLRQAEAKLKALLRKAAVRTKEALWQTVASSLTWSRPLNAKAISPMPDTSPSNAKML